MTTTCDIAISLDGYGAGPNQSLDAPFGQDGARERLVAWMLEEREQHAAEVERILDAKAFVMGRNMFSPHRGPHDLDWQGWWGPEPPYRGPVFVLTHHERAPLTLGETTFTFVTDGFDAALGQAKEAAGDGNVSIAGGVSTVNQALKAGAIDELRLHVAPCVLGAGERLFDGVGALDLVPIDKPSGTALVTHRRYRIVR
jgi:dihydrofolate reductase